MGNDLLIGWRLALVTHLSNAADRVHGTISLSSANKRYLRIVPDRVTR